MRVEVDPNGICVSALDEQGEPLASVLLDYYADRLTALAQDGTLEVPPQVHVLVRAASAARRPATKAPSAPLTSPRFDEMVQTHSEGASAWD
jgi:hypothetical protein